MNIITGLEERQREKQLKYERRILREISMVRLQERVREFFAEDRIVYLSELLEEACFDVAVEAFLLGGNYSRFGYYGESEEEARQRSEAEEKHLIDTLYNFILYWGKIGDLDLYSEGLYYRCTAFVGIWWQEGFSAGTKYYKLRLH